MIKKKADYYATRQDGIVNIMPEGTRRVLEVGCGRGLTGRAIKEKAEGTLEVVGIEIEPEIAEKAKKNIDTVLAGDAENMEIPFKEGYFDCMIYGNILEHLVDPWALLRKHGKFLNDRGCVVASIPNIAHYRTIKMLLRKEWNYAERGILDETHLRFFTLKSIKDMFTKCGLDIVEIKRRISASKVKKVLNKILFGALLDYITEEYLILARKAAK